MTPRELGRRVLVGTCGLLAAGFIFAPGDSAWPLEVRPGVEAEAAVQFTERELWFAPAGEPVRSTLAMGVDLLAVGNAAQAEAIFSRELRDADLGAYARLYLGRAQLAQRRAQEAAVSARAVMALRPGGYLGEAALWLLADAAEALEQWPDAVLALQALTDVRSQNPASASLRLARAAEKTGDLSAARAAFAKVYYEFPLSSAAEEAGSALTRLPASESPDRIALDRNRAEQLFSGRRFADAKRAFADLRPRVSGEERVRVDLRLAQIEGGLLRFESALEALRPLVDRTDDIGIEARFAQLSALRSLKRDAYVTAVRAFASSVPSHPLTESALNDLATFHILANDDASAAAVFAEMYERFPTGAFADRAAWKAGWWAYKNGHYRETIRLFDLAVLNQGRADYRPSWLYWAARAHEQLAEPEAAANGYRRTMGDYRNSYYGREAEAALARLGGAAAAVAGVAPASLALTPGGRPERAGLIESLLSAGLFDDAIQELRKIQRERGTSPAIDATLAYAHNRKGDLRPGITAMRRAYPQFMAAGGEALPRRLLAVIFPIEHWDLLRRHARDRNLDPYLIAAQVAQESSFQVDVRSTANAYGLMQVLPSTGQRYATRLGIRRFTVASLTDPDVNVRIGTTYMADLLARFGDPAQALAAYNAGENRVSRWRAERPGIARDEFVDDIPFPETQNYVKRIIGTAEDYRILYGESPRAVAQSAR